jgi:hypothetical protein
MDLGARERESNSMTLRRAVAAPFRQRGVDEMTESEFVVALSLDRSWFSPDQAKRLVDVATGEGLLELDGDDLRVTFDRKAVALPEDFEPSEDILQQRSTFERLLEEIVAEGVDKQTAVAEINKKQADLALTLEAAAALYGLEHGVDVADLAERASNELIAEADSE